MDKSIQLVNDLRVDIDNIPEDFADQVIAAFEEFTELTAKEYRHEDTHKGLNKKSQKAEHALYAP